MATPENISEYRGRYPLTKFSFDNVAAPAGVVLGTNNQYENITVHLAVQSLTNEAGFTLNTDTAGDEFVEQSFPGPTLITATMRLGGGIITEGTFFGLLVNSTFIPGPIVLANIPDNRTDISTQDSTELMYVSWLVENAKVGDRYQLALASSLATTLNVTKLQMLCDRMSVALNDA